MSIDGHKAKTGGRNEAPEPGAPGPLPRAHPKTMIAYEIQECLTGRDLDAAVALVRGDEGPPAHYATDPALASELRREMAMAGETVTLDTGQFEGAPNAKCIVSMKYNSMFANGEHAEETATARAYLLWKLDKPMRG